MAAFQSGPIQTLPEGLLGLLQLKSPAGKNPDQLEGNVQPTVDLLQLWLNRNQRMLNIIAGIAVGPIANDAGFTAFSPNTIATPQNEWWFVHEYTVTSTLTTAGDTCLGFAPAMRTSSVGTIRNVLLADPVYSPSTIAQRYVCSARNFWMPPGCTLVFFYGNGSFAGNETFTGEVRYTPLPV